MDYFRNFYLNLDVFSAKYRFYNIDKKLMNPVETSGPIVYTCVCVCQLPMVLKVPRIATSRDQQVCSLPYSLLGFGDILVPGNLCLLSIHT